MPPDPQRGKRKHFTKLHTEKKRQQLTANRKKLTAKRQKPTANS